MSRFCHAFVGVNVVCVAITNPSHLKKKLLLYQQADLTWRYSMGRRSNAVVVKNICVHFPRRLISRRTNLPLTEPKRKGVTLFNTTVINHQPLFPVYVFISRVQRRQILCYINAACCIEQLKVLVVSPSYD